MLIETLNEKRKCVCCKKISVNEYFAYEHCGILLKIPMCTECQKTATFLLVRQLKPLCNAISKAVMMSNLLGEDEYKLQEKRESIMQSKLQQIEKEQNENGITDNTLL